MDDQHKALALASLHEIALENGVPALWLSRQSKLGRIPSLRIGELVFFERDAVRAALAGMARTGMRFPRRGSADPVESGGADAASL